MKEVMVDIYRKIKQISSPFFRSCCLVTFKKSRGHLPLVTFRYYQDGRSLISSFSRSSKMAAMSNSRPWGRHAQSISRGQPPPHRLNIDRCISCVRVRTNVILAGKCDSHRHSSTSFSENVVVAKTSYQMLQILSFIDRERAFSFKGNKRSNFRGEKKYDAFRGVYFQRIGKKFRPRQSPSSSNLKLSIIQPSTTRVATRAKDARDVSIWPVLCRKKWKTFGKVRFHENG